MTFDKSEGRVSTFSQSNPLFDQDEMSLGRSDLYNVQGNDLKKYRGGNRLLHFVVVYLALLTGLNAFVLYKVFTFEHATSLSTAERLSYHKPMNGEQDDLQTLIQNTSLETKSMRGHLGALQSQVNSLCGDEGQIGKLRLDLGMVNASTHLLEGKLATIALRPGLPSAVGAPGPAGPVGGPGQKGDTGDPGAAGSIGPQGPNGEKGERGSDGMQGGPGVAGPAGAPGLQGIPGQPGPQGLKGDPGDIGLPGSPGNQGPGAKGERGATGSSGPPGIAGRDGAKGDKGEAGTDGAQGLSGPSGPSGLQGPQGTSGLSGPPGAPGSPGSPGAVGPIGPMGPPGIPGVPGPRGAVDEVRLIGGRTRGRVEVNHEGVWGTVCDDNFDSLDGTVICKMLGFRRAQSVYTSANSGTGQIWLDELQCTGSETNIFDCPHSGRGVNDCTHSEDAGVQCV